MTSTRAHVLGHVAGATATLLAVRQAHALLSWIARQVSFLPNGSGRIQFYSVTVSADGPAAAFLASTVLAAVALVVVGTIAEATERVRRRFRYLAMALPAVGAVLGGFALASLTRDEDVPMTVGTLIEVAPALLLLLLSAIYWSTLVAVSHTLRRSSVSRVNPIPPNSR